jgi:hypothetical protein
MKVNSFCNILNDLGYKKTEYNSSGNTYVTWTWYHPSISIDRVSISYLVDSNGIIRQQFSKDTDIISLTVFINNGRAPGSIKLSFIECIDLLYNNCYGDKIYIRDYKLKELGI